MGFFFIVFKILFFFKKKQVGFYLSKRIKPGKNLTDQKNLTSLKDLLGLVRRFKVQEKNGSFTSNFLFQLYLVQGITPERVFNLKSIPNLLFQ